MARYIKKNGILKPVSGAQFADTPIGTVIASFLAVAPSGYIKCDDTVYTKAQYPDLYERIPDVFKDTTNETFTIDLREVALKGIGLTGLTVRAHISNEGLTLGEFTDDQLARHCHVIAGGDVGKYEVGGVKRANDTGTGNTGNVVTSGSSLNANVGNTTEVKAVGVNYFIKAKQIGVPADIMAGIEENFATKEYVEDSLEWTFAGRAFANGATINVPATSREIKMVISNTGSTITAPELTIPAKAITTSNNDEKLTAWTSVGGTVGSFTVSGDNIAIYISNIASSYVRVWYR